MIVNVMKARMNEALLRKYIAEVLQESAMSELKGLFALSVKSVNEIVKLAKEGLEKAQANIATKVEILQHLLEKIRSSAPEEMPEADDAADLLEVFVTNLNELLQKLKSKPVLFGRDKHSAEVQSIKEKIDSVAKDYFGAVRAYQKTTLA
jgi:hypothetical protein